jgi:hypothetical protein
MKVNYKGFEIESFREKSLGGWPTLYYSIYTPEGYELLCSFEDSAETVRDKIKHLKEVVDDFILNPHDYIENDNC